MPQKLSQFRDSSELITSSINVYLTDYGAISTIDYEANANLFKKAYDDILSKRFSSDSVNCTLWCPAGDYYFGGNPENEENNYPLVLSQPQIGSISIRGYVSDTKPSTIDIESAGGGVIGRYSVLSSYYTTRFHFDRNGVAGQGSGFEGNRRSGGLMDIGLFGRYNGSPGTFNKDSSFRARGVTGNIRLQNCCVHGFGIIDELNSLGTVAAEGWGIGAHRGNTITAVSVQVVDCNRGFYASENGTISSYGDCCSMFNRDVGMFTSNAGHILFASGGNGYISNCSSHGVYAVNAASVQFGRENPHTITSIGTSSSFTSYSLFVVRESYVDAHNVSYSNQYTSQGGSINTLG